MTGPPRSASRPSASSTPARPTTCWSWWPDRPGRGLSRRRRPEPTAGESPDRWPGAGSCRGCWVATPRSRSDAIARPGSKPAVWPGRWTDQNLSVWERQLDRVDVPVAGLSLPPLAEWRQSGADRIPIGWLDVEAQEEEAAARSPQEGQPRAQAHRRPQLTGRRSGLRVEHRRPAAELQRLSSVPTTEPRSPPPGPPGGGLSRLGPPRYRPGRPDPPPPRGRP